MFLFCSVKKINKSYQITKSMPLSSCSKPLFSSEAKCSNTNKTHFHKKSFALTLVLKVGVLELRNGLLGCYHSDQVSNFCQSLWTKCCKVTIQTKTLKEYFHTILVVKTESPMN